MEIPYQGTLKKDEFLLAARLLMTPSRREGTIRIIGAILIVFLFVAPFVLALIEDGLTSSTVLRSSRHLLALPIVEYFILLPFIRAYESARKLWPPQKTSLPQRGAVSSQGITYISSNSQNQTPWNVFARIRRTNNLLALLTPDGTMTVLTPSLFSTESDWQTANAWANASVVEPK